MGAGYFWNAQDKLRTRFNVRVRALLFDIAATSDTQGGLHPQRHCECRSEHRRAIQPRESHTAAAVG